MLSKLVALMLAPLLLFQTLFPMSLGARNEQTFNDGDVQSLRSVADYVNYIQEHGAPALSTETFLGRTKPLAALRRILNGQLFSGEEAQRVQVTADETMAAMYDSIRDGSGFDTTALLVEAAQYVAPTALLTDVFRLDTDAARDWAYAQRDKYAAEGKDSLAGAFRFLGVYFSVIRSVEVFAAPTDDPDVIRITLRATYRDGTQETFTPATFINTATGLCYGEGDVGMFNIGFNVNIYELMVYGTVNAWQRNLGFMLLYDLVGGTSPLFNFVTRRYKFTYGGKEWMIQAWKGNYLMIANGAELGVYNREKGRVGTYYDCAADEELMDLTMELFHGDELLFAVGPAKHWWLNGFRLGKALYLPETLTMRFSIAFPNEAMRDAFTHAVDCHILHDAAYTVDGLTVTVTW